MDTTTQDVVVFPTSFAQRRLWFLDQVVGAEPVYHVATEVEFDWAVNDAHFVEALALLGRRHDALRTTFALVDGEPMQVVHDRVTIPCAVYDLSAVDDRDDRLEDIARALGEAPFDLAQGPLLRTALVRFSSDSSVAVLIAHHIITDGWSSDLLEEDILAVCDGLRRGTTALHLPDVAVQYGDYAVWQRRRHADAAVADQLDWWVKTLAGAPASLSLPIERTRPPAASFRGESVTFALPARITRAIQAVAQRSGATSFMATLAAFEYLLATHCGTTDLVVGVPVSSRPHPALDRTVGFFVNTLALRTRLPERPTFVSLLECVRDAAVEAYARQDVPFEAVVTAVAPPRQAAVTPLFQVMFTFAAGEAGAELAPAAADQVLEIAPAQAGTAKFDLTLALAEGPDGLSGVLEYNADVFTQATMREWIGQYHALLEYVVAHPSAPLAPEALMPAGDRAMMVETWNQTATPFPREATILSLFADVVARHGARIAVVDGARQCTYIELAGRSAALAARLRACGVGRGAYVGVCADRSIEFVLCLLATLQCGAAYVPLDPDYPAKRMQFMVEDSGVRLVLTTPAHAGALAGLPVDTIVVGDAGDAQAPVPEAAPADLTAEDLAYVIYTSGSTGRPKGVAVTHRGIVRLVRETDYLTIGVDDVLGHASNTSFDAATFEIWGALLNGARLVVITRDLPLSPRDLIVFLRREGVSILFVTTPLFNQIAALDPTAFGSVRELLFGGDAVDPGLVRRVLRSGAAPRRLLHVYGPTETTTFATWHHVRDVAEHALNVPIGRAVANSTAYVLDPAGQPVPVGVPGELYLGGDGLAREYLGQPEATAARFVASAFDGGRHERLYRTGDLARWIPGGALEFLGRIDRQVKIRGVRVEPSEIEVVLTQCPGVGQAAVVPRPGDGGRYLAAYVAPAPDRTLSAADIRAFLRARLPDYMVPTAIVALAALPLNANGKIDRDALPDPQRSPAEPAVAVLPRSALEETIAGVWRTVLQRPQVGVEDNFFDLGGHSLLLIQVLEHLRPLVGVELRVLDLFRYPTVAALCGELSVRGRETAPDAAMPTAPEIPAASVDARAARLRQAFAGRATE